MLLKFKCETRDYTFDSWDLFYVNDLTKADKSIIDVCPIRDKLFNQDIFRINENLKFVEIISSCNRTLPVIPAILSFKKLYGKIGNKYLFKASPDDCRLPDFIVPYRFKKSTFSKKQNSKYVVIKFNNWDDKHPYGSIVTTIGDVGILENFYEYMLYCMSLYASIQKLNQKTHDFLKTTNIDKHINKIITCQNYNIQDRRQWDVICIDPKTSKDFDDGFGIKRTKFDNIECYQLSIYIANVPIWLDSMNLWSSLTERISTIYLPDRKRPMLPSLLSDNLCSLQENKTRFAFALDIFINDEYKIINSNFSNCTICVNKNYDYNDTEALYNDRIYTQTLNLISEMNHYTRYKYCDLISDSHDVIAYLMVLMNYISAQKLKSFQTGIFRTIKLKADYKTPQNLPKNVEKFIKGWNSTGGQYLKFEDYGEHEILNLDAYVHITSPIRRLVDILNIMLISDSFTNFEYINKKEANDFYNRWTSDSSMDYINTSMRAIRKLQNNCDLLNKCYNDPNMLLEYYTGYCFDKIDRQDGLFQYVVYIPELNMISKYTGSCDIGHFETRKFQLYLFKNENTFKQKIKMNLIE